MSYDAYNDEPEADEFERERVLDDHGADYRPPEPVVFPRMLQILITESWVKSIEEGKRVPRVTWCGGALMWRWKSHKSGKVYREAQSDEPGEWKWLPVPIRAGNGTWEFVRRDVTKPYRIRSDGSDIIEWQARRGESTATEGSWHALDTCPWPVMPKPKEGDVQKLECPICEQINREERMLYGAWCQQNRPEPEAKTATRGFKKSGGFGR